jgi:uncharacterized protein YcfJ
MNAHIKSAVAMTLLAAAGMASAQITFYEDEAFRGRAYATSQDVNDFNRDKTGFNDRASSVIIDKGRWELCQDARFGGQCRVLRRGNYESLASLGLGDSVSSVRKVTNNRNYQNEAPEGNAEPYAYRQRANERTYQANVTSARAVVGSPTERCWIERQQAAQPTTNVNGIGGALLGGLLGGVLGHQVGGGSGQKIATVGGAVAGAAVGYNVAGRNGAQPVETDVRRCENVASTTPEYWDVTYEFRGVNHRMQMTAQPGNTVAVNAKGEPRL